MNKASKLYIANVDIIEEPTFIEALAQLNDEVITFNAEIHRIHRYGPAGGNPNVEITGKSSDLLAFLKEFYKDQGFTLKEFKAMIKAFKPTRW
jgi:hypothetical protein